MTTVTAFTAARSQEIEDSSVVTGHVTGDNLMLTTRGGTVINAGNVRGPMGPSGAAYVICTSTTRPTGMTSGDAGTAIYETDTKLTYIWIGTRWKCQERIICASTTRPVLNTNDDGVVIYEVDTNKTYEWNGTSWTKPTGFPWGQIGYDQITANTTPVVGPSAIPGLSIALTHFANRRVKFGLDCELTSTVDGTESRVELMRDGSRITYGTVQVNDSTRPRHIHVEGIYTCADTLSHNHTVNISRVQGTGLASVVCAVDVPAWIALEDLGHT